MSDAVSWTCMVPSSTCAKKPMEGPKSEIQPNRREEDKEIEPVPKAQVANVVTQEQHKPLSI